MDNIKTGELIRELRKEKGMTQKDLAEKLYITDRAVSKWERGLCAPDISLLEPLSELLGVSVLELISGKLADEKKTDDTELSAKRIIEYSQNDTTQKMKRFKRNTVVGIVAIFIVISLLILTVASIRGEGFSWGCIPAYISAQRVAKALQNCDKQAIEMNIANAKNVHNGLVKLEEQHICIRDAKASVLDVRLDDGILLLEIKFAVNYQDVKYIFTCYGTYKNGKVELMRIVSPNGYDEYPEWILELNDVLCTYNPG